MLCYEGSLVLYLKTHFTSPARRLMCDLERAQLNNWQKLLRDVSLVVWANTVDQTLCIWIVVLLDFGVDNSLIKKHSLFHPVVFC